MGRGYGAFTSVRSTRTYMARIPGTATRLVFGTATSSSRTRVSTPGRLHALVADDEQSIRVGRKMGAEAIPWRHRADRGASHVLRQVRVRQTRQRRLRV